MGKENKNDLRNEKRNEQKHTTASQPCDQSERLKKIHSLLEEIRAEDEETSILVSIIPAKGCLQFVSGSPIEVASSLIYMMQHAPNLYEVVKSAVDAYEDAK